ncbi:MAG TPA: cobalamin biosynthesis protein CbiG [Candidatus Methanoperedenaceae archaeon]|nr:cobalamin biosynthesis protein CbiG [Candidatus Methanoperedenaceae archaeon]
MDDIAIVTFRRNEAVARKIQECVGGSIIFYSRDALKEVFGRRAVIAVMALGIAVRRIAPLLRDKWTDSPVVVVDSSLKFAIPLVGGHHGANALARRLLPLGTTPVITTATEAAKRPSVEGIAEALQCDIVNRDSAKHVNIALLEKDVPVLEVRGPKILVVDSDVAVLKRGTA